MMFYFYLMIMCICLTIVFLACVFMNRAVRIHCSHCEEEMDKLGKRYEERQRK